MKTKAHSNIGSSENPTKLGNENNKNKKRLHNQSFTRSETSKGIEAIVFVNAGSSLLDIG